MVGNQPVQTVYQFNKFLFFRASNDYTDKKMSDCNELS